MASVLPSLVAIEGFIGYLLLWLRLWIWVLAQSHTDGNEKNSVSNSNIFII